MLAQGINIALTVVIAAAAAAQAYFAATLYRLQKIIEDSHNRVSLFSRLVIDDMSTPRPVARLQIANLSSFPVWLERCEILYASEEEKKEQAFFVTVEKVLESHATHTAGVSGAVQSVVRISAHSQTVVTTRVRVVYWANGGGAEVLTPRYRLKFSINGLDGFEPLR